MDSNGERRAMTLYRVRPGLRRRFAPYTGDLYAYAGEGEIPEYILLEVNGRKQRVPREHFERVEATHEPTPPV
jgi:hypothetical protein